MVTRLKKLIRVLGLIFIVMAASMIPSAIVAVIYDEMKCLEGFLLVIIPSAAIGILIFKTINPSLAKYKTGDGYIIVSACWIIFSVVGALPFIFTGSIPNVIDAIFESVSGFTTTGSTILTDIEVLPKSILFWRSFTHWLGGMGIIVFAMILFPSMGIGGQILAGAETPGPTLSKLTPKFSDTAKNLYRLYLIFTIVETLLLMISGLSLYDALVQTFGTVGTGGFSNYNASIAHFNSYSVQWIIIVFMFLSGINFNLYFMLVRGGIKKVIKDSELKLYIALIIVMSLFIFLDLLIQGNVTASPMRVLTDSVFQVTSIITTTGFATADYTLWPMFAQVLILCLFFIGACSSSTGGGVKVVRIAVCLKLVKRGISLKMHPNRVTSVNLAGQRLSNDTIQNIANFVFFYILLFFIGSLIITIDGADLATSFTSIATSLGNVGPGFGSIGPVDNFNCFSGFSKCVLSVFMIAGRLELFTLFVLFYRKYWNDNRA